MDDLSKWLASHDLDFSPVLDGKIKRFSNGDKKNTGWYIGSQVLAPSGREIITLTVSDWRCDDRLHYRSGGFSNGDLEHWKKQTEKHSRDIEKEKEEKWRGAAVEAKRIAALVDETLRHSYPENKKINIPKKCGVGVYDGKLVVPLYQQQGEICGLQFISEEGTKRFLPGTKKMGAFFTFHGDDSKKIAICEGFATGASIFQATGITTFVAFDCGNLGRVSRKVRESYPDRQIWIAGDDDVYSKDGKNPGRECAELAAKECGGVAIFPEFGKNAVYSVLNDIKGSPEPTDWNDLHVLWGIDEVRRQIQAAFGNAPNSSGDKEEVEGVKADDRQDSKTAQGDMGSTDGAGEGESVSGEKESDEEKIEKKKKRQEKIRRLGRDILDCRFKLFVDNSTTILYNITNIQKKELAICVNEEFLLRRLAVNIEEKTGKIPDPGFVSEVFSFWKIHGAGLKEKPKSFTWSTEDEWSFKKLDFSPCAGEFPSWQEFLYRLSSPDDFMAFIWSIFEIKNRSRQFLYMTDPVGEGGKSTVLRVLGSVFGGSHSALSNSMVSGSGLRWLLGQIYGKRLVTWADCKNPKFCMSELVRNITSGDSVSLEFKGQNPFSDEMYIKLIIGSNHEPQITSGGADTSRLINIHVAENKDKKDDPEWESRLKTELPYFLNECRRIYAAQCPNHGKIVLSDKTKELVEESTGDIEDRFHAIMDKNFELNSGSEVTGIQMIQICKDSGFDCHEIGNFKEYLARVHRVHRVRTKPDRDRPNYRPACYKGIRVKLGALSINWTGD